MDFALTDAQRSLQREVRRFAEHEIVPVAQTYDREERYPAEVMEQAAEMELLGPNLPCAYGGADLDPVSLAIVMEELFAADPGIALCITSAGFGAGAILEYGTDEQCKTFLPGIPAGDVVMGVAITEPDAGSDVTAIRTRAEREDDDWVLNGRKCWITNGSVGDQFLVLAETDPHVDDRYLGYSMFLVEADRDGVLADRITGKLGVRASDTAELVFDDVRIPERNLIGTRGLGFAQLMTVFDRTRTMVAAQGVGIARGAFEAARSFASEREQFGRPIAELQAIRHKLAEMAMRIEAARTLAHRSAWSIDHAPDDLTLRASMAKAFGSEVAVDVADEAVQIHGAAGYVDAYDVSRFYRDAKVTQIYEGTTEIQYNIIARELLADD